MELGWLRAIKYLLWLFLLICALLLLLCLLWLINLVKSWCPLRAHKTINNVTSIEIIENVDFDLQKMHSWMDGWMDGCKSQSKG